MASTPYISHSINGYSRYDIPESVAFSASAGVLYPIRCDFMNARDVRYIQCGSVIRTNPAIVPTFTPFRCSLHRFFVPMQLYHPEMRVNASNFDMQNLSTNCIPVSLEGVATAVSSADVLSSDLNTSGRCLVSFLGLFSGARSINNSLTINPPFGTAPYVASAELGPMTVNCDVLLGYYDIVRSYYSFSQNNLISWAFPYLNPDVSQELNLFIPPDRVGDVPAPSLVNHSVTVGKAGTYWRQAVSSLAPVDTFFESSFYPVKGHAAGLYYNRLPQLCDFILSSLKGNESSYDTPALYRNWTNVYYNVTSRGNTDPARNSRSISISQFWLNYLPFGVAPAVADRFSRLLPNSSDVNISLSSITTVRGLAFASKLQAYKDLLSSGGSRFSDWLMTFFAAKVSHVDRPVLVYSSSFYLNSNPIFSQQGDTLGQYAGVIEGQRSFGKHHQRYCFDEPGYLIDIFSIRPLYYWSGIQMDYARYDKLDYFNPIFNEVGYESIPGCAFGVNFNLASTTSIAKQPCYNEFRSSFDRVLGDLALVPNTVYNSRPYLSTWVQQRSVPYINFSENPAALDGYLDSTYFTDIEQANSIFASTAEDNFFVNVYYNVTSKSLVSKNFATNLATR